MLDCSKIENVPTTVFYLNRKDQTVGIVKTSISCSNESFKDNLIHFLGNNNHYKNKKYVLQDVLKYTVDFKSHYDVTTTTDFERFALQGWKYTNERFVWADSIKYFQDLNEFYLLFKEKSTKLKSNPTKKNICQQAKPPKKTLKSISLS